MNYKVSANIYFLFTNEKKIDRIKSEKQKNFENFATKRKIYHSLYTRAKPCKEVWAWKTKIYF